MAGDVTTTSRCGWPERNGCVMWVVLDRPRRLYTIHAMCDCGESALAAPGHCGVGQCSVIPSDPSQASSR